MSMTRDETQAVIDRTNQYSMDVAMQVDVTIADRFEELVAERPDTLFLIYADQAISYRQFDERANAYARIAVDHGVKKGDAVALMMENRPEFLYAWFGALKVGAATALINTGARSDAMTHAVTLVDCKLAFVGAECGDNYLTGDDLPARVPTIDVPDLENPELAFAAGSDAIALADAMASAESASYDRSLRAGLKNSDTACYMYTSGTTGLPKAAYITHSKWLATGQRWLSMAGIEASDIFYCPIPIYHGAGLMSMFSSVLAVGSTCVLRRRFSARNFWKDIAKHKVTVFIYVGEICRYLLGSPPSDYEKNHTVRLIWGAGLGIDIWQPFVDRFGSHIKIYEGWGSTESNCNLANIDNQPGSCGRIPYWDKTFMRMVKYDVENDDYVRDENGFLQLAEAGEVGELLGQVHTGSGQIVSPFDGYTNKEATEKKLQRDVFEKGDCWFSTGDLFRCDADGYFYFVDRIGDTYRWKSENVSTTEVVHQLTDYADAEIINIYGVKVPGMEGRAGMAAVVMAGDASFDGAAFYAIAVDKLQSYAVPLFVRVVEQMDMTGSFKLRKVDLQRDGYNPDKVDGPLYVLDHAAQCYTPYSVAALDALGVPVDN